LREERKQELEEHVEAVNRILKEVEGVGAGLESEGEEGWGGIEEEKVVEEVLDHEEEYVDEDRYTTVTVEAVEVSKEGLLKVVDEDSDEVPDPVPVEKKGKEDTSKKKWPKKERKKKFRYESKAERKVTRGKQKAGNKARADARKGNS
jgi:ribosomal RNA-processing protein 17